MRITTVPHKPDHTLELGISLAGCDWDATVGYDVLSTPADATLTDPPEGLDLDVWALTLTAYYGDDGRVILPAGVHIDPMAVEDFDRIEQACIDNWHESHSKAAREAEAADYERDAWDADPRIADYAAAKARDL